MTGSEIMGVVGFFVLVSGALWGIWWKISGMVEKSVDAARKEMGDRASAANMTALVAREEISALRLHCAENFITKSGLRDVKDEIMEAMHGMKASIDGMNANLSGRIDSMYTQGNAPRPRAP